MDGMSIIARLLLAAVFAIAGIAKLADRTGSVRSMRDFGLPPVLAGPVATLLPLTELACAIALLPASSAWWGALGVLLLLVVFILGISVSLARGRAPDCHCFGQLHSEPVGWNTVARNVALAAVAGFIVSQNRDASSVSILAWLGGALGSSAVVIASIAVAFAAFSIYLVFQVLRQNGRLLVRLEAIEAKLGIVPGASAPRGLPVDSPAPEFSLPDLDGQTVTLEMLREADKPVLLVFSEPGCGACDELLPDVATWQREHAERVSTVVISRGTIGQNRNKQAKLGLGRVLLQTDRETAEAYQVAGTPSAVLVTSGRIARPLAAGADEIRSLVSDVTSPRVRKGEPAPDLTLPDLRGEAVSLATLRGRRSLLLFWNPTCGYCQKMLDALKRWERNRPATAPALVVISTGSVEANREQGFVSPVLLDEDFKAGQAFGVSGTPSALLLDEHGRVGSDVIVGADAVLAMAESRIQLGSRTS
jgi:peroxiredoxin/uncharacterized membrane protein YphA (DoxX/SURF4 family)